MSAEKFLGKDGAEKNQDQAIALRPYSLLALANWRAKGTISS